MHKAVIKSENPILLHNKVPEYPNNNPKPKYPNIYQLLLKWQVL